MRDNFTSTIKRKLADRVAWRCSFPGCSQVTIGPSKTKIDATIITGEAAHIHAASLGGPRYNSEMDSESRKSIENGIWLCRTHSKIIDSDSSNYTASTLLNWKLTAEGLAHSRVMALSKDALEIPTTLVSLDGKIIFESTWKKVVDKKWTFEIIAFIKGTLEELKEYSVVSTKSITPSYIIIESQGDGRLLHEGFTWLHEKDTFSIEVTVMENQEREDPDNYGGDFSTGEDGDLEIENGDFKIVKGIDAVLQDLSTTLSVSFGDLTFSPLYGSHFREYFMLYQDNIILLNRLTKIEIARLASIPFIEEAGKAERPPMNSIKRVLDVEVEKPKSNERKVAIKLKLLWPNDKTWAGVIKVFL